MAAITINTADAGKATRWLEDVTITNQTAASTAVTKAVKVPGWAKSVSFYLYHTSQGGTTPKLDLEVGIPDFSTAAKFSAPTDDNVAKLADVASITQITGTAAYLQTLDIGPGVTGIADDVTGAAAADARMAVNAQLPPWLTYTYTTQDAGDDADYAFQLVAHFKG